METEIREEQPEKDEAGIEVPVSVTSTRFDLREEIIPEFAGPEYFVSEEQR